MPRRPLLALAAMLLVPALLAACAAAPAPEPTGNAAFRLASARHAFRAVESPAEGALRLVPERREGSLAVFLHGWSQNRFSMIERPPEARVAARLASAGFVVLSADAGFKSWGDPAAVRDYERLIAETVRRYDIRDVFLMGESMGGLATMQLAARVPEVRAVVAWYPVCNLRTMRHGRFTESIREAWPGTSGKAVSPVPVSDTPMLVYASPDDTVVDARTNAAVCVEEARRAGATVTYFHTSGNHGDPSNFDPDAVLQFFASHRTPGDGALSTDG